MQLATPTVTRIALFVDVQNIYYTTREIFSAAFNYRILWQQLSTEHDIVSATAYAIERHDTQQQKFQDALRYIGFEVKLKPYIQRSDGSAKGDWDVGITIDMLQAAHDGAIDRVVLLSGDGDFDLLLTTLESKYNIRTDVYSVEPLTANSLINACSCYHPITETLLLNPANNTSTR